MGIETKDLVKGLRVRRIHSGFHGMLPGEVGTIFGVYSRLDESPRISIKEFGGDNVWHDVEHFIIEDILKTEYKYLPDYLIKGTKLPKIPVGINAYWNDGITPNRMDRIDFYSFGFAYLCNEVCVLAERKTYEGNGFYGFDLKDVYHYGLMEQETKKIIGYKLIDEKYRKAALVLVDNNSEYLLDNLYPYKHIPVDSHAYRRLQRAGVLDIWFEKVYETKVSTLIDSQGRKVKVEDNKIIINDSGSNISYNELKILESPLKAPIIGSELWPVELKNATYKIGCWDNVTLEDIKKAIEAIEEHKKLS